MNKLLFFFSFISITMVQAQKSTVQLIPQPVEIQELAGAYTVTNTTTISYNKAESRATADMLTQKLNAPTGFSLKAQRQMLEIVNTIQEPQHGH